MFHSTNEGTNSFLAPNSNQKFQNWASLSDLILGKVFSTNGMVILRRWWTFEATNMLHYSAMLQLWHKRIVKKSYRVKAFTLIEKNDLQCTVTRGDSSSPFLVSHNFKCHCSIMWSAFRQQVLNIWKSLMWFDWPKKCFSTFPVVQATFQTKTWRGALFHSWSNFHHSCWRMTPVFRAKTSPTFCHIHKDCQWRWQQTFFTWKTWTYRNNLAAKSASIDVFLWYYYLSIMLNTYYMLNADITSVNKSKKYCS